MAKRLTNKTVAPLAALGRDDDLGLAKVREVS